MMASENGHTAAVGTWLAAAFPGTGCERPCASSVTGSHGSRAVPVLTGTLGQLPLFSAPSAHGCCATVPASVLLLPNSSCPSSFQSSCCTKQKQI